MAAALRTGAVAVAVVGTVLSVLIAQGWQATVTRQRDERLDRTAAARTVTIKTALGDYENALRAARSLWLASSTVTRKHFGIFARTLDLKSRYPGLQGISWRQVVPDEKAAEFVAEVRADGARGFAIRPPGRRPVYYVTRYSYPVTPFSSQLGLDARATGQTTMSSQTTLPDDLLLPRPQRPVAFELFLPVYQADSRLATVADRRKRFVGWASGQFRAGDFLEAALRTVQPTTGVELHDEELGAGSLVASSPPGSGPTARTSARSRSPSAAVPSCCATPPDRATPP